MDLQAITKLILDNLALVISIFVVAFLIMMILVLNMSWELSRYKKRYKKMMTGVESDNLERMLLSHIDETRHVAEENMRLNDELKKLSALLDTALTRISVMRFCAFEETGSDLSFAIAMLDAHDDGIVLSSIFGRDDSRSYVKPIEHGTSTYALSKEEQQVLKEAMSKRA